MVPALAMGRPSTTGEPLTVMVVPAGIDSVPLPPIVPPLHVMAAPVRLRWPLPLRMPPVIVSVGRLCAEALLIVSVAPLPVVRVDIVAANVVVAAGRAS